MRRAVLALLTVATMVAPTMADQRIGTVAAELPDQVGVYEIRMNGTRELNPSDIVKFTHGDRVLGEATVLRIQGSQAVVSLKGVYNLRAGAPVEFARSSGAGGSALWSNEDGRRARMAVGPEFRRAQMNFAKLAASKRRSNDQEAIARVNRIGSRIVKASGSQVPWTFMVVNNRAPNAACTGEGFVFVHTGLLAMSDDEVAYVIGHEVGHGVLHHLSNRQFVYDQARSSQRDIAEAKALQARYQREYRQDLARGYQWARHSYESKMATAKRRLREAERKQSGLRHLERSQQNRQVFKQHQETEADMAGLRLMAKAGYDPGAAMTACRKLRRATGDSGGYSHPTWTHRLTTLQNVYASWVAEGYRR